MEWWEYIVKNLPTVILILAAVIFIAVDVIKAKNVIRAEFDEKINKKVAEQQGETDIQNEFKLLHDRFDQLTEKLATVESRSDVTEQKLAGLIESDKNNIKSWIVEEHFKYVVSQGWIDYYHLDVIEHRYADYKREGGNTYIDSLMEAIRGLPMEPPHTAQKKE